MPNKTTCTHQEIIEGIRELYEEWRVLRRRQEGLHSIRLPDFEAAIAQLEKQGTQADQLRQSLRAIKLTALTATSGSDGLCHIIRLCINAGITEKLPELEAAPPILNS